MKNTVNYGMINSLDIDELIMIKRKQKYLDKHPYAIWQSKDGKYWYTNLPDKTKKRGTRQIRRNSEIEIEKAIIEYWEEDDDSVTLFDLFKEWNDNELQLRKIVELTHYRKNRTFEKYLDDLGSRKISTLTAEEIADYLEGVVAKIEISKKDYSVCISLIKGSLKWGKRKRIVNFGIQDVKDYLDIPEKSFKKNIKEDYEEVYTEQEMPILVEYLINNQDIRNLGLLLIFVTGIRIGELSALKHSDFKDNILNIRRTEVVIPHGGYLEYKIKDFPKTKAGVRSIVVPDDFRWLMDKLGGGDDEFVFLNKRGERIHAYAFRDRLEIVCKKAGIPYKSPHKIRKTYGSILLDHGVDHKFVMEQMGHSSIITTENFYHKNRRNNEKKAEILNGISDFKVAT